MPLGSASSDAITIIISLRAISYFLQHNEGGEIRNCTFLFQSPWSAHLSSGQTPRAFNENCGRPNFLCCPWFSQPQIIRWGAAQKGQCVIFIVSLHQFSVGVNFSILFSVSLFSKFNILHNSFFFSCWKKNLRLLDICSLDRSGKSESASSLTCVWFFVTAWTVAHQAPLSMEFSRQEYWSELLFPSPGDLPDLGIEPPSPIVQADSLPSEPPRKPTR